MKEKKIHQRKVENVGERLNLKNLNMYSPFHKTLQNSTLQMHWISVRFNNMGDIQILLFCISF